MKKIIQRSLGWKLFISYVLILLLGLLLSGLVIELLLPSTFNRHMSGTTMMDGGMMSGMMDEMANVDLLSDFQAIANEAILIAGVFSFVVAGIVSVIITRQLMKPVNQMKSVAQDVSTGDYSKRVKIEAHPGERDELEQLATILNKMTDDLEQIEMMRRELIGDVSHELRTPLTVISGVMEGLLDKVIDPTPETFQKVRREAWRLSNLVNDLQELSFVEGEGFTLTRSSVKINELVKSIVSQFEIEFSQKYVSLSVNYVDPEIIIELDENRMIQVFTNLIGNAYHFTPAGGNVELSIEKYQNDISISIRDSGIGIAENDLPHIFQRFYRADKSRSRNSGGSGIGLTIAKHIIEMHGGKITVESNGVDQGTLFIIRLPHST